MMSKRTFSLLEVMLAIAILAMAGSAVFFRVNKLIERNRFDTDTNRLKALLLSSRTLSLNTHSDWRLDFKKVNNSWEIQLHCLEDLDLSYPTPKISQTITFNGKSIDRFAIDFFATGLVRPSGTIGLHGGDHLKKTIQLPDFFGIEENGKIAPFHPKSQ
jgi:type II secretory pathway pseudopilin PulG